MTKTEKLKLLIKIIQLQIKIKLLKQKLTVPSLHDPKHIVVHHTASNASFEQVNNYHKAKWGFLSTLGYYMGYTYFIEKTGIIRQARRDGEQGAHTVENGKPGYWNKNSIGICLQGNFETEYPPKVQREALEKLLDKKRKQYGIPVKEIYGHKEINPTLCPGFHLFAWLGEYKRS